MALIELSDWEKASPLFRGRAGNALARGLMKGLSLDAVCRIYDEASAHTGTDFAKAVLDITRSDYQIGGLSHLEVLENANFITVSNHVYGALDGLILADFFGHLTPDYKILVNKVLGIMTAFGPSFITVIPTGEERTAARKESIDGIYKTLRHIRKGGTMGFFPSGAVSDLSLRDRAIRDRAWQEPVIRLIRKARVPVVPVRFFDRNSLYYYLLGLLSWRIRLLRLPKEAISQGGKPIRVGIGSVISVEEQDRFSDLGAFSDFLRTAVYGMELPAAFRRRSEMDLQNEPLSRRFHGEGR